MVAEFRKADSSTPIVLMGYANPIEAMGVEKFVAAAKAAGVDGVIVVDYPPEECEPFAALAKKAGIDPIFLLAPTSTDKRIEQVGARRQRLPLLRFAARHHRRREYRFLRNQLHGFRGFARPRSLPIGVGFGIRDAESARRVAQSADAVVIGSRIIQEIEAGAADGAVARVKAFLKPIRQALDTS